MNSFEGKSLLGESSSKIVLGSVVGACLATALLTFIATPSSLYVSPTSTVVAQAPSLALNTRYVVRSSENQVFGAAMNSRDISTEETYSQSTGSWSPIACVAALPIAIFAAFQAFKATPAVSVDPIDLLKPTQGTSWRMVAVGEEVAQTYAIALVDMAEEGEALEAVHNDIENIGSLLDDEEMADFLLSPGTDSDELKEVVDELCQEYNMSEIMKDFLYVLIEEQLMPELRNIAEEFEQEYYSVTDTQVATVTAADALDEEQLRMLANKLHEITKAKNVKIKSQVDEGLMAGFVLEYGKTGSSRIDLSLKKQIEELRSELSEGARNLFSDVPAAVQLMVAALGVNLLLASQANAAKGNIFDFGITLPIQMAQFLLLMVFLEKTVFTPVGKVIDDRAAKIKEANAKGSDSSKEIAELNAKAEALLKEARMAAARELEATKKAANEDINAQLTKAKAENEKELELGLAELQKIRDELWTEIERDVVPALATEIVASLEEDEEPAAQPETVTAAQ